MSGNFAKQAIMFNGKIIKFQSIIWVLTSKFPNLDKIKYFLTHSADFFRFFIDLASL